MQAYLGVIILQPHACTQRFRLRILRRTRSNAGRTSARSLSGRIESIWETPSKERGGLPHSCWCERSASSSASSRGRTRFKMYYMCYLVHVGDAMCIVYRLLYHIAHIAHKARTRGEWMFSGLPCKTHTAHIARVAKVGESGGVAWWCGPVRAWCAWCGPGAGLGWAQDCSLNPALATGLPQPFLRHTQDCRAWSCSCSSTAV